MINFTVRGERLCFDEEHLTVEEARAIKQHAGLTIRGFLDGLREYDVDALVALIWLAKHRAGEPAPWNNNGLGSLDLLTDIDIIPDEEAAPDPPPGGATSTSTAPPSPPPTRTGTGRTGSARSRSTSATPPPRSTP